MITLNFNFAKLTNEALTSASVDYLIPRIELSPTSTAPIVWSGSIVVLDKVTQDLVSGSASFADVIPGTYKVEVLDQKIVSPFYIVVPNTGSGVYNAANFFTSSI